MMPPFHMSAMAMVLFGLSVLADSRKRDDITIAEVKGHVCTGDLIEFLTDLERFTNASGEY
jgi:hypothetical protein